jgi:hypothetical protein
MYPDVLPLGLVKALQVSPPTRHVRERGLCRLPRDGLERDGVRGAGLVPEDVTSVREVVVQPAEAFWAGKALRVERVCGLGDVIARSFAFLRQIYPL